MAPYQDGELPLDPEALHPGLTVYDLVYRPLETKLLAAARKAGCQVVDGLEMLASQGARALEIWTGRSAPVEVMEGAARAALGSEAAGTGAKKAR
jgi:shikimate dehydrogenase